MRRRSHFCFRVNEVHPRTRRYLIIDSSTQAWRLETILA